MGKASRRKKGRLEEARVKGSREKRQARQEGRVKLFLRRNKRGVRAGLIFAASVGVSIFIFSRLVETEALFAFLAFTAQTTGFVLNILGMNVEVNGSLISSGNSARAAKVCTLKVSSSHFRASGPIPVIISKLSGAVSV